MLEFIDHCSPSLCRKLVYIITPFMTLTDAYFYHTRYFALMQNALGRLENGQRTIVSSVVSNSVTLLQSERDTLTTLYTQAEQNHLQLQQDIQHGLETLVSHINALGDDVREGLVLLAEISSLIQVRL